MWAQHRALLTARTAQTAAAPVVAQAWCGGGRQALLARLLRGCDVETLDDAFAGATGALAAGRKRVGSRWASRRGGTAAVRGSSDVD